MIATISRPLAVISTIGWLLTLGLSVAALAGARIPSRASDALLFSLFPLYLGALAALGVGMKNTPYTSSSWLRRAIARAPKWTKFMLWGSFWYAIVAHAAALIFRDQVQAQSAAGFGVWMALFSIPAVIFSTTSISLDCPKGHAVGPFEQYCRTCGAPILGNAHG